MSAPVTRLPSSTPPSRRQDGIQGEIAPAFQELWFALARRPWSSLVLVPADEGGGAAQFAAALADVGRRLRNAPVSFFVVADPLDPSSTAQIASTVAAASAEPRDGAAAPQMVVAIQPVVTEPLGVAIAQAADTVVLCVEKGRSRLASARRTIDLVGRDRIGGCFLVG